MRLIQRAAKKEVGALAEYELAQRKIGNEVASTAKEMKKNGLDKRPEMPIECVI